MSKQVLKAGALYYDGQNFGLLDVSVIEAPTKIDAGDTGSNYKVEIGRENWAFSVLAMKNNSQSIKTTPPPPTGPVVGDDIVITFGGEAWFGKAVIESVALQGRLDDKVVYQIAGQFVPSSYHIAGNMNMVLEGGSQTGIPDGWNYTDFGGAVESFVYDDKKGRYWSMAGINAIINGRHYCTVETGETHGICIVYESENLSQLQIGFEDGAGTNYNLSADTAPNVSVYTNPSHAGAAGENQIYFTTINAGGGAYLRLFSVNFGKLINSLT